MRAVDRVGVRTVGGDMAGACDILALWLELPVGSTGQRLSKEQPDPRPRVCRRRALAERAMLS